MQSRAILMMEHRFIEKIISLIDKIINYIQNENKIDPLFVEITIDFLQKYADKTHHGKEEDILFKILKEKKLSDDDKILMDNLKEEHFYGREITNKLYRANKLYRNGDKSALRDVMERLRVLNDFYPKHIKKEDEIFLPASMKYLSEKEDQKILDAYYELDKSMVHEYYISVINACEKQLSID